MADIKITDLPEIPTVDGDDILLMVDVSDETAGPNGTDKKATIGQVKDLLGVVQTTGSSTTDIMSQKAVSDELDTKLDASYMTLKIFQSPTDDGLTEVQTRIVDAGEVYEVRKTYDDSLATIYSDAAGTIEIVQDGTNNISGGDGVVEFYVGDGDYYIEVDSVKATFSTVKSDYVDTTSDLSDVNARLDQIVRTKGFNTIDDGGAATYICEDSGTPDLRVVFASANGKFFRLLPVGGYATTLQAGETVDDTAIGTSITKLISVGAKHIFTPQPYFTGGNIDLQGVTLEGINTRYEDAVIFNGTLRNIQRVAESNQFVKNTTFVKPTTSKSRIKTIVKVDETPNSTTSPYNEVYMLFSPSSNGGISAFCLANGIGASGAIDMGGTWDRLRVVNSYLCNGGFYINRSITASTGTHSASVINLVKHIDGVDKSDLYATSGLTTIYAEDLSASSSLTYNVKHGRQKTNVYFHTSPSSSSSVSISVGGIVQKTVDLTTTNLVVKVDIDLPLGKDGDSDIRIDTDDTGRAYVYGVDIFPIDAVEKDGTGVVRDNVDVVVWDFKNVLYSGVGASLDSVIVDENGDYGGAYHGGDLSVTNQTFIRIDSNRYICETSRGETSGLALGSVISSDNILVSYQGYIDTTPQLRYKATYDYSVDGGCYVAGSYYAESGDVTLRTIFTTMHSTDRGLFITKNRAFDTANPTGEYVELKQTENPVYQYSTDNRAVCIMMDTYESNQSNRLSWLRDTANYIKFYYTPVSRSATGSGLATIKNGEFFNFNATYLYGNSMF